MKHTMPHDHPAVRDYGMQPFVFNIDHATSMNTTFRTVLWTGRHLQLTVMCIPPKCDIGTEMHNDVDQFLCVESGQAKVYMGQCKNALREMGTAHEHCAILIPAGTWHNVVNVGTRPLKLYSLYAPPQHPRGTVHRTKEEAGE